MVDPARRAEIRRDLRQDFIPCYDAQTMPSAGRPGSPEPVVFREGYIERNLGKIAVAFEPVVSKA
jgi:hypothetical protein